ncbi:thioredoxin family protein [Bacteriovoracaceae bacterium]|nr:thioredoxin family protein [Bacteriovoracaceae bacterium]
MKLTILSLIMLSTFSLLSQKEESTPRTNETDYLRQRVQFAIDNNDSLRNAFNKAKNESKYLIINIGAFWCGPCHRLQKNLKADDLKDILSKNFITTKIDMYLIEDIYNTKYSVSYRDSNDGESKISVFTIEGENCNTEYDLNAIVDEQERNGQLEEGIDLTPISNEINQQLFEDLSAIWGIDDAVTAFPTLIIINPKNINSLAESKRENVYIQRIDGDFSVNNLTSTYCNYFSSSIECFLENAIKKFTAK